MKRVTKKAVLFLAIMAVLFSVQTATASEAIVQLRATIEGVIEVLKDASLKGESKQAERRAKIRASIQDGFDFEEMSKRALVKYWRELSAEEKADFTAIFSVLIENSYINRIEQFTNEKIVYKPGKTVKNKSLVRTRIIRTNGTEIPVDYKLIDKGAGWQVYDVVVEGVSLVRNYRSQFGTVKSKKAYQELVEQLKQKIESASLGTVFYGDRDSGGQEYREV